jgi:hypothetical protein
MAKSQRTKGQVDKRYFNGYNKVTLYKVTYGRDLVSSRVM